MTDEPNTEEPRTLKVFTCINRRHPTRSCYALIEDTDEMRAKHRAWHVSEEAGNEGKRSAIKARDEEIAKLREEIAGYRRDVQAYSSEVASFHGEVQRVETPTPSAPLEINRDGYTDDELDDEDDTVPPETANEPAPAPDPGDTTNEDDPSPEQTWDPPTTGGSPFSSSYIDAVSAFGVQPAIDRDDDYPPTVA